MDKLNNAVLDSKADNNQNSFKLSYLTSNPGRKAIIIGIFLIFLCYFSGILQLLSYSASIFKETGSGSAMSANKSTVILGVIRLAGSLTASYLVERIGRKVISFIFPLLDVYDVR